MKRNRDFDENEPRRPASKRSAAKRLEIERAQAWSLYMNSGQTTGDPRDFDRPTWSRNQDIQAANREERNRVRDDRAFHERQRIEQKTAGQDTKQGASSKQPNRANPFLEVAQRMPVVKEPIRTRAQDRER